MSEIEKIQRYIKKTKLTPKAICRYCMNWDELEALRNKSHRESFEALCLAFDYGHAKGYRAAKAEMKHG